MGGGDRVQRLGGVVDLLVGGQVRLLFKPRFGGEASVARAAESAIFLKVNVKYDRRCLFNFALRQFLCRMAEISTWSRFNVADSST